MAVICRQEVFAFCRAEVLQDGEIFVVVYTIIKERSLIILVATFRGCLRQLFSLFVTQGNSCSSVIQYKCKI